MIAAGISAKMGKQLQKVAGPAGRVNELIVKLREMAKAQRLSRSTKIATGSKIEFKNVTIETPTVPPTTLVKNLDFCLAVGDSILLTGHNGAGKSSIFRCLGGLWNIPEGEITKPGAGSGLHNDVFYLPQKPYNVLGTLRDQLTYPADLSDSEASDITRDDLIKMLARVDLAHLAMRAGAFETETNWEEVLSLGEKQRLAIARLLYHKPKFAILDECTSAVSGAMEHRLYEVCNELGITYITISHRPVLKAFHKKLLTIGEGDCGYSLVPINHESLNVSVQLDRQGLASTGDGMAEGELQRIAAMPQSTGSLVRFARLLRIGLTRTQLVRPLAGIVASVIVQAGLLLQMTSEGSQMMAAIFKQDRPYFAKRFGRAVALAFLSCLVEQANLHLQRTLQTDLQTGLCRQFQRRLMANNSFYRLSQIDGRIKDGTQRIADDVQEFAGTSSVMIAEFLKPTVELAMFTARLTTLVGPSATGMLVMYLAVGAMVIRAALPNYKAIVTQETKQNGKFKLVHSRVRTHAESIAFFGGDNRELAIADKRFEAVQEVAEVRLRANWSFGIVNQGIIREAPMLTQWLLRNEHGKQFGHDEAVRADGGAALNASNLFIYESVVHAFESIGNLLSFLERFASLAGYINRVSELDEVLLELEHGSVANVKPSGSADGKIRFHAVDLATPTGQVLARKLSVEVSPESPLMVTGPNASGKTSFFRALGGLWPVTGGSIECPVSADGCPGINDIFLVPQRMYMSLGTLADQVTYPLRFELRTTELEVRLQALLDLVGIGYLPERQPAGWGAVMVWEDVLSLGEQQRMGMARLFFHSPSYGVLDECTSAVSVDVEERLYREARNLGISCVTISQRLALTEFHKQELRFGVANESCFDIVPIS